MQSTSCETPGWMRHRLESRLPEEIIISNMRNMLTSKEGENALGSHFETKAIIFQQRAQEYYSKTIHLGPKASKIREVSCKPPPPFLATTKSA